MTGVGALAEIDTGTNAEINQEIQWLKDFPNLTWDNFDTEYLRHFKTPLWLEVVTSLKHACLNPYKSRLSVEVFKADPSLATVCPNN